MEIKRLAVLLHERDDRADSSGYLLWRMMDIWRKQGLTIDILHGTEKIPPADVLIPHLDLTITPQPYRDFIDRYPTAINRRIVDISKSKISPNVLKRDDAYDGEVIVKTDLNYGGFPENRLSGQQTPLHQQSLPARLLHKAQTLLEILQDGGRPAEGGSWRSIECMKSGAYPIFPSLRDVPRGVFKNKRLVVEKFLPERDGSAYCLRYCYFFGDRTVNMLMRSNDRVVKGVRAFSCDLTPAPPEMEAMRRQMGLDFGKLDYVLRDGKIVLFDVNRTPATASLEHYRMTDHVAAELAAGLGPILH